MIVNPSAFDNAYECNKPIMEYLAFKCHLPVLSCVNHTYYFTYNEELKKCLEKMPFSLKVLSFFKR